LIPEAAAWGFHIRKVPEICSAAPAETPGQDDNQRLSTVYRGNGCYRRRYDPRSQQLAGAEVEENVFGRMVHASTYDASPPR
jgi:hypothetical protein